MIRRTLVALFVVAVVAGATAPALAYEPYLAFPTESAARLVPGTSQAVCMWSEPGGGATTRLMASRVPLSSGTADGPFTVVSDIGGLEAWYASGDGLNVTVLWRDGSSVFVKQADLLEGATAYGPVLVSSDALAAAVRGAGAKAVPAGVAADGDGGAYVWCALSPTTSLPGIGDSLLNHVSAAGVLAVGAPGASVESGTVAALSAGTDGGAFALLGPPGRNRVAVRRYAPGLSTDWTRSPYLVEPSSVSSSEPLDLVAGSAATIAWREDGKVKLQRFSSSGSRLFLFPPSMKMAGAVRLAVDGSSGAYVVGPSGDGIVARHILATGSEAPWGASSLDGLELAQPRVDAVTNSAAGDLFATYSDAGGASATTSGVAQLTYLGSWSGIGPSLFGSAWYPAAAADGVGGAYIMGNGADACLWHMANPAAALTFRPQAKLVQYGRRVAVRGFMYVGGGLPSSGGLVTIGMVTGGSITRVTQATTDASGFYSKSIKPTANATWTATGVAPGDRVAIKVAPKVTLALSHTTSGTRLTEIFSGSVAPRHAGSRVVIQKAVSAGWRTVASGRLNGSSRYRVTWTLPYRTATYKLRAAIPAHADHAEGASSTATLRVVVKKG